MLSDKCFGHGNDEIGGCDTQVRNPIILAAQ